MEKITLLFIAAALLLSNCDRPATVTGGEDSPTSAYKKLYSAVKAKDIEGIKAVISKKTMDLAKMASSQQKKSVDEVVKNGFTETTFADSLPQIRDERINGDMGAVEVYNAKSRIWEDLPFIREDGGWKLAVGDIFAGTWKSPGKGTSDKEREAANLANGNNLVPSNLNTNSNLNTAPRPVQPKPATNMQ